MGKYSLGDTEVVISEKINKKQLFVDEKCADSIISDIENELLAIEKSFMKVQLLINQFVNMGVVAGKRGVAFKSWARKAKSQANQAEKLIDSMKNNYQADVKNYPIQLLDQRIAELEKKIDIMNKNM